jgi:hypothetical protein
MTNKSKMKLKKFNFLGQHRTTKPTIAPTTEITKYRIKRKEPQDENILTFTRGSQRPQYI